MHLGNDQEKAQPEKIFTLKTEVGRNLNCQFSTYTQKHLQNKGENSPDVDNIFRLNVYVYDCVSACGNEVASDVGYIYPPMIEHNGRFYYETYLNCSWIIKVKSHVLFTIYITDIEPSAACTKDFLKVV